MGKENSAGSQIRTCECSGGFHPSRMGLGWSGSFSGFTELEVHIMETVLVLELMAQLWCRKSGR